MHRYALNKMKQDYTEAAKLLQQYVEQHNLRVSYERGVILKTMCEQDQALSSTELVEAVKQHNISRATVFNTLKILLSAQIISPVQARTADKTRRYELNTGRRGSRIEVVCTKCGRITQSTDKVVETQLYGKRWRNFNISGFTVYVYGECKHCRALTARNKK